ncbi:HEAT repeat domain-containing protein, partial [bacterium]|nr:HEAT repeat domain-containing protein [bacterium]
VDSDTRFTQEVWKPYGLRGSGQLHEDLRFHMALDLLTEVVSDDDVPAVVSLLRENLGDSVDDVINVLSGRRDASRAALRHMLKDSSDVARENAARALGEIGTVEDVPAFSALLDDASPRVRRAAVSAFETLPVQASEAAKAAALANDPDPQVAIPALHVGSTYGQRSAGAAARKVLAAGKHHPIELRIEAARALARMSDAAAAAAVLRPVLAPDPSGQRDRDELLKFAAWSAGASGDQGSLESLEALASSEAGTYEAGVYFAIARAGGLRFLAQLAANGTDHSRRLALRALGSATGDTAEIAQALTTAAEQAFEPKSGGRDFNDFLAAYRALLDRSDERSRPAIGRLLETVVERRRGQGVTDQMLWTLVPIAEDALSKEAAPAFEKIVTGPGDPYLRRLAAEALSVVDAPRAKTFLSEQIGRTSNPELQAAMARGLARSGDPSHMDRAIETSKRDVDGKITGEMPRFALRGDVTGFLNMLGCDYAYAGKTEEAILCFRRMRWLKPDRIYNYSSYNIACSLSLAGKLDDALRWLRRSIRDGFHEWRHMRADPDFLNLNKDPRFLRLVDEMRTEQEIEPMEDGY